MFSRDCEQGGAEQWYALTDLWVARPASRHQFVSILRELGQVRPYCDLVDRVFLYLVSTPQFTDLCSLDVFPYLRPLSVHMHHSYSALWRGDERQVLGALAAAFAVCASDIESWVVLRAGFMALNKLARFELAQLCAIEANEVACRLGDNALRQRSRYAVLRSSRLARNVDVNFEFARELALLHSGSLTYEQTNQSMLPVNAALHGIDTRRDLQRLPGLLGLSAEIGGCEHAEVFRGLAESGLQLVCGRRDRATRRLHEALERMPLSHFDLPLLHQARRLSRELGVDDRLLAAPVVDRASWCHLSRFRDALANAVAARERWSESV